MSGTPRAGERASGDSSPRPGPALRGGRPLDAAGIAAAVLTCTLWGSNGVAGRIGTADIPPWTLASIRGWIAFLLLALVLSWRRPKLPRSWPAWRRAVAIGVLQTGLPTGLFFWGVHRLDAGLAMVMMSTQPLFVALLLQRWPGGERLTGWRLLALLGGFAGVGVVAYAKSGSSLEFHWPALMAIGAGAASWAAGTLIMRQPGPGWEDFHALVTCQMAVACAFMTAVAVHEWWEPVRFTSEALLSVVYMGLFTTAVGSVLWFWSVQRHGASRISAFVFAIPVSGVLLGAIVLGEPLPPLLFPGLLLVAASLALVNLPESAWRGVTGRLTSLLQQGRAAVQR
ncbi:putative amino-acid metabolite efflux pump [bacterium HR24]|nr:putative amino-acid metabolite efflux pump [bacterium HR24]